jgi:hypothetical protein
MKTKKEESKPLIHEDKTPTELYEILSKQKIENQGFQRNMSTFSFQYWREEYRNKYQKKTTFLIWMQLRNGKMNQFKVSTSKKYFEKFKGIYFLDSDMSREETHSRLNVLYYHQDICTPFKIEFDVSEIHELIRQGEKSDVESQSIDKALNPTSLKGFINSEVIEKVLKGQELSDEMRLIKILLIILMILQVIGLFILAKSLGWM